MQNINKFSHFLMDQSLKMRQWSLLIAIMLYSLFLVMDIVLLPKDIYFITVSTRLALVMAPLILLNYIFWFKPPQSALKYTTLILCVYIGAGINHSVIHYFAETNNVPFSNLGLVLIVMFGCLLLVLPVFTAALGTIIILIVYAWSNYILGQTFVEQLFPMVMLSFVATLCLIISNVCQGVLYNNFRLINQLYDDSITDGLTTLHNKRFFEEQTDRLIQQANRSHCNIALILIDIDNFKTLNDQFGHVYGDSVLVHIAKLAKDKARRPSDYSFRIGGDEMAIVLFDTSLANLESVCTDLVQQAQSTSIKSANSETYISLSIGAVLKQPEKEVSLTFLFEAADKALYLSKKNGRNQYSITPV